MKHIDQSQACYEKYSQSSIALEGELTSKGQKRAYQRQQESSKEFFDNQREALKSVADLTENIYGILEKIARREIEKDPVAFIRENSFI